MSKILKEITMASRLKQIMGASIWMNISIPYSIGIGWQQPTGTDDNRNAAELHVIAQGNAKLFSAAPRL